jgi:hypothetical protein
VRCTFTPELREHLSSLQQSSSSRFKSGRWVGSYRQFDRDNPQLLDVGFEKGLMVGTGADQIGLFLIAGRYDEAAATAEWLKHYIGRHTVVYSGKLSEATLSGSWILRIPEGVLTGSFTLVHSDEQS